MKRILVMFLVLLPYIGKAQYCSPATTNVAITVTTVSQNTASYNSGIRAFNFAATAGCIYTFSTCGLSTADTYLRLYSTGTGGTVLATSDDFCSLQSQITWTCPTTGTYSILLTNFSCVALTSATRMSYIKTCPVIPANDNCANATLITLPYTSAVTSTAGSTDDIPTSASGCGTQSSNLWYKVVGNNTTYTATTCNGLTNYDTEVRVYTGACGSMTEVVCNDDDGVCASSTLYSTVSWCAALGTTYYISVGYWTSGGGTGNFVLNVTSGTSCTPLPIELLNFDVYMRDSVVAIEWTTATETNCDYFIVERSVNVIDWIVVGQVVGNGTTTVPHFYQTEDHTAPYGYNYYRLKQVDYNGQYEIFAIKSVYKPFIERNIVMMVDVLGQQISDLNDFTGLYIIIYDDGTSERKVKN